MNTPPTEPPSEAARTAAEPVLFRELPLGSRFSYIGHPDRVYIILERHGYGLICSDESVRGWTTGQQILSADESEELTASLKVIPVADTTTAALRRDLSELTTQLDAIFDGRKLNGQTHVEALRALIADNGKLRREVEELRAERKQITPLTNGDIRLVIKLTTEQKEAQAQLVAVTKERDAAVWERDEWRCSALLYHSELRDLAEGKKVKTMLGYPVEQKLQRLTADLDAALASAEVGAQVIRDALDIVTGHGNVPPTLWRVEEHLRAAIDAASKGTPTL